MTAPEEGIEIVDVRTKWPNEAYDFTPWLAKNLRILGEAVGLKLEPVREEQQVGSFSLDILARETNEDVLVAIENQLEWTDHSHLGQLLTYAAGCDTRIAIWVAAEFQYEHAEALHQLNQWAGTNIRFYGVKVDVIRTTDSSTLVAKFHKVVSPYGWNKGITLPQPPPPSPYIQKFRDFFQPLINEMLRIDFAEKALHYSDHTGRFFPSWFDKDTGYAVSFSSKGAWAFLNVRTWDSIERNNRIFDELQTAKSEIEQLLNAECVWDKYEPYSFFTISVRKDGSIDDSQEKLEETRAWMLDLLPKLKEAFEPRLQKLLK